MAAAGLERLGLASRISQRFTIEEMAPAACQGTIAVVARAEDTGAVSAVRAIDDAYTHVESRCERAFLERLGGDCDFPAGVYAKIAGDEVSAVGVLTGTDEVSIVRDSISGPSSDPEAVGRAVAARRLELSER